MGIFDFSDFGKITLNDLADSYGMPTSVCMRLSCVEDICKKTLEEIELYYQAQYEASIDAPEYTEDEESLYIDDDPYECYDNGGR